MALSRWQEEFERRKHPDGKPYFWLTGVCHELEAEAKDTDRWALHHGYVAITPTKVDVTDYEMLDVLKTLL